MHSVTKLLCLLATSIVPLHTSVKTWRYNSDIFDPDNWLGGKPSEGCRGVIFPENFGVTTLVDTLYTEQIVFANDGQIAINDGGFIELNDNPKCIKLKELNFHGLHDPDSWLGEANQATPLLEKIPCGYDEVVFPSALNSPILHDFGALTVKSVRFPNDTIDIDDLNDALKRAIEEGDAIDRSGGGNVIEHSRCVSEDECVCENYSWKPQFYALYGKKPKMAPCIGPVDIIGNPAPSCGATIVFEVGDNFKMAVLKNKLKELDEVDVHASRIGVGKVQVVFADRGRYVGKSVEVAKDFYGTLLRDRVLYSVANPILEYSGSPAEYDRQMSSVTALLLSVVFVAAIFGGVYVYYYGPLQDCDLNNRLRLKNSTRLTSTIFARYDRNNEENLILEGDSIGGSVIDLSKSFENRAYGAMTPSTSTTTDTTSGDKTFENPLYDLSADVATTTNSETFIEETTEGAIEEMSKREE